VRVVQEKTVAPSSSRREETVTSAFFSATHKNLADLRCRRALPEDLFYRINVNRVASALATRAQRRHPRCRRTILGRMGKRMNIDAPDISEDAYRVLHDYPFPGNVRELENVLERALTLCTDGLITRSTSSCGPQSARPMRSPHTRAHHGSDAPVLGTGVPNSRILSATRSSSTRKTRYNKPRRPNSWHELSRAAVSDQELGSSDRSGARQAVPDSPGTAIPAGIPADAVAASMSTTPSCTDSGWKQLWISAASRGRLHCAIRRLYPTAQIYSFRAPRGPAGNVARNGLRVNARKALPQGVAAQAGSATMHVARGMFPPRCFPLGAAQIANFPFTEEASQQTVSTVLLSD